MIIMKAEGKLPLANTFEKLGIDFDKAVNIALNDTSDKMANTANENLANSIGVNSDLFGSVVSDNNKPMRKFIGTNVEHAPYVEFGTGPQKINKKGQKTKGKQYWPPALPKDFSGRYSGVALDDWRRMKGKKFDTFGDLRFAIYKYGTRPQSFLRNSLQRHKRKFPEFLAKSLSEMSGVKFEKR